MRESDVSTPAQPLPETRTPATPLSVIVLTCNEETNLPECLDSLHALRCEIFVLDSGSTDATLQIAKSRGVSIHKHPFENYAAQRNWSQQHLPLNSPWLLHLDADERLTPELVTDINRVLADPPPGIQGFHLRKRTIFMGRWIRHGGHYTSYHLRHFRKDRGRCEDRLYDQHFVVDGPVTTLDHDYLDVVSSDINTWTLRHARWSRLEAQEMLSAVPANAIRVQSDPMGTHTQRKRWLREGVYGRAPLFIRPFLYWFYRYFFRLGFLDGTEGFIFHFLQGCWYRFLIDCEISERRKRSTI